MRAAILRQFPLRLGWAECSSARPRRYIAGATLARGKGFRAAAAWRYKLGFYRYPLELRPLQRLLAYQRPETCGF